MENQSTAKREERQRRCFFSSRSARRRGKRRAGSPSTARGGIRGADGSGDDAPGSARHRKRNFGRGSGGDSPTAGAVSTVATTALAVLGLAAIGVAGTAAAALGALDGALELARGAGSALGVAVVAVAGCGEDRRGGDGFISDGTGGGFCDDRREISPQQRVLSRGGKNRIPGRSTPGIRDGGVGDRRERTRVSMVNKEGNELRDRTSTHRACRRSWRAPSWRAQPQRQACSPWQGQPWERPRRGGRTCWPY